MTTPFRTGDRLRRLLPFDEALAVADSALRSGLVTREELDAIDVRGAGAAAVRRVLRHADARAANPFESVLRALCLEAGLTVEPQGEVVLGRDTIHPDLVCRERGAVVEGDSWTWHATRKAHGRDCARYNLLAHPRVGRRPLHLGAGDAGPGVRALGARPAGRACRTCRSRFQPGAARVRPPGRGLLHADTPWIRSPRRSRPCPRRRPGRPTTGARRSSQLLHVLQLHEGERVLRAVDRREAEPRQALVGDVLQVLRACRSVDMPGDAAAEQVLGELRLASTASSSICRDLCGQLRRRRAPAPPRGPCRRPRRRRPCASLSSRNTQLVPVARPCSRPRERRK